MTADDERLETVARNYSGRLHVAALDVESGERMQWAADVLVPTASVIKVGILCQGYERLRALGSGQEVRIPLQDNHRVGGSGVLKLMTSVEDLSFHDLAELMIAISDNVATNALMQWAGGPREVTARLRGYGLEQTIVHDYVTPEVARRGVSSFGESTARELCALGERLAGLSEPSAADSWRGHALAVLADQQFRDLVTRYWDLDTAADLFVDQPAAPLSVCSKTGFFPGMRAELGIVLHGDAPRMVYAVVADRSADLGMGPEAEPAVVCGLVGLELAKAFAPETAGIRLLPTPYTGTHPIRSSGLTL